MKYKVGDVVTVSKLPDNTHFVPEEAFCGTFTIAKIDEYDDTWRAKEDGWFRKLSVIDIDESESQLDVSGLEPGDFVRCKTRDRAQKLLRALHEAGHKWKTGESLLEQSLWHLNGSETCYIITRRGIAFAPESDLCDEDCADKLRKIKYKSLLTKIEK